MVRAIIHAAQALVGVATALRLLGAQTVLAGIRPEVAQTLVALGIELAHLRTAATLQSGLDQVLGHGIARLAA